jgi:tetratricopeptide (TPR) repeat protein
VRGALVTIASLVPLLVAGCAPVSRLSEARRIERGLNEVGRALADRRLDAAVTEAEALVRAYPDSADAAVASGDLFRISSHYIEALRFYRMGWEIQPRAEIALAMAACIWLPDRRLTGEEIAAVRRIYSDALARWPDDAMLLNDYAYFLADLNIDIKDARAMARRALALSGSDAAVIDTLAWALYRNGEPASAFDLMQRALALDGSNEELRSHMAAICRALGRDDRARIEEGKARRLRGLEDRAASVDRQSGTPTR